MSGRTLPLLRRRDRRGYVMLVALLLMAILAVIGSSTLQIAGLDHRIAIQNRKHMMVVNTSHAGTQHARVELQTSDPANEGIDTAPDTWGDFINASEAETQFTGLTYAHNLGVYWVTATYHRCGNPPPGYSTEAGISSFRADYWEMRSTARQQDASTLANINETQAVTSMLLRKVKKGTCKIA